MHSTRRDVIKLIVLMARDAINGFNIVVSLRRRVLNYFYIIIYIISGRIFLCNYVDFRFIKTSNTYLHPIFILKVDILDKSFIKVLHTKKDKCDCKSFFRKEGFSFSIKHLRLHARFRLCIDEAK